jgi:hypothetical protein
VTGSIASRFRKVGSHLPTSRITKIQPQASYSDEFSGIAGELS